MYRQNSLYLLRRLGKLQSLPTRRSSDLLRGEHQLVDVALGRGEAAGDREGARDVRGVAVELAAGVDQQQLARSEEHTSELQSPCNLVCRLLLEKKKKNKILTSTIRYTKR